MIGSLHHREFTLSTEKISGSEFDKGDLVIVFKLFTLGNQFFLAVNELFARVIRFRVVKLAMNRVVFALRTSFFLSVGSLPHMKLLGLILDIEVLDISSSSV